MNKSRKNMGVIIRETVQKPPENIQHLVEKAQENLIKETQVKGGKNNATR